MFIIPKFQNLSKAAKKLETNYKTQREAFDKGRFFASFRPATNNLDRFNDTNFIKSLEHFVENLKTDSTLGNSDSFFKGKDYERVIAPYLKEVISGAFLLVLIKITHTYSREESVKTNSALGQIILDLFKIDKLSDVPSDQLKNCLSNLNRFLDKMPEPPTTWHQTLSKVDLQKQIAAELQKLPGGEIPLQDVEPNCSLAFI